jgi:hypothetical protein
VPALAVVEGLDVLEHGELRCATRLLPGPRSSTTRARQALEPQCATAARVRASSIGSRSVPGGMFTTVFPLTRRSTVMVVLFEIESLSGSMIGPLPYIGVGSASPGEGAQVDDISHSPVEPRRKTVTSPRRVSHVPPDGPQISISVSNTTP